MTTTSMPARVDVEFLRNQLERRAPIGQYQLVEEVQFGSPNTDLVVRHSLRPGSNEAIDYQVLKSSGLPLVYHDTSPTRKPWGRDYILLRSPVANLKIDLLLTVRAKAPGKWEGGGATDLSVSALTANDVNATNLRIGNNQLLYEVGTWTPTLRFGGATTGITYGAQVGNWTRIGELVYANFRIALASKGTAVGTADIVGLSFTAANPRDIGSVIDCVVGMGGGTALPGTPYIVMSGSTLFPAAATTTTRQQLSNAHFDNNADIRASITFRI